MTKKSFNITHEENYKTYIDTLVNEYISNKKIPNSNKNKLETKEKVLTELNEYITKYLISQLSEKQKTQLYFASQNDNSQEDVLVNFFKINLPDLETHTRKALENFKSILLN